MIFSKPKRVRLSRIREVFFERNNKKPLEMIREK